MPRILDCVADVLAKAGVAGEDRAVKLIFLILVTRLLKQPVSAKVTGPSSAGKSHIVAEVLRLFPASAFYALNAIGLQISHRDIAQFVVNKGHQLVQHCSIRRT